MNSEAMLNDQNIYKYWHTVRDNMQAGILFDTSPALRVGQCLGPSNGVHICVTGMYYNLLTITTTATTTTTATLIAATTHVH
jgi:hypothetical protein